MPFVCRALHSFSALLITCVCLLSSSVHAEPDPVPEPLKAWVSWSLKGSEGERCAKINDVRTCVFPSALTLQADRGGATFSLHVSLDRQSSVALPGSAEHFPLEVHEGKVAMPVVELDGSPSVLLSPGSHTLTGRFAFNGLPDSLQLPANLATLELKVDGKHVDFPKREANGLLWLKQSGDDSDEERLNLSVHRRIDDSIPLRLTTRVHVSAGGKGREVLLPNVLVPGTRPIELRAGLPVELTAEGALRMQIQAGEHDLEIVAIRETNVAELSAPEGKAPWPERELWVLKTDERLRHVEVSGPSQIDPARTDLAPDWRGLPTYVLSAKQVLKLETRRRGEPEPAPNQLTLRRSLWLDLDGDGYTVRDELGGQLHRDFRLDLLNAKIGHAVDHAEDQLVTRHGKLTGVELRRQDVQLQTEWRLEHGQSDLPAVGYNEDAHALSATLYLPPGYMLLGAEGVDQLPGTWLDSWDLFDFFFVLLVSLAVAKVSGKTFGLCALLTLVLTHHEPDAPTIAWVFLLAMTALQAALKSGRLTKWIRAGWLLAAISVVLVLLPFSVMQVRKALYPHLDDNASGAWDFMSRAGQVMEAAAPAAPPPAEPEAPMQQAADAIEEEVSAAESGGGAADMAMKSARLGASKDGRGYASVAQSKSQAYKVEIDPSAVVQTGPGLPTWNFRQFSLNWSGPVQKDERIQLWIAAPLITRVWALASVLFSGLLLLALARVPRREPNEPPAEPPAEPPTSQASTTVITLLFLLGSVLAPHSAAAQSALPSQELLTELRERLLEPAPCEPNCLAVSSLFLRVEPRRLSLTAEVHAQALSVYQAPGPLESWAPESVRVDGKDAFAALRSDDGFLYVRLEPGVHKLELTGPIPHSQAFTLALGSTPHLVSAEHKGFVIDGLRDDGRAEGSLSIRREVSESAAEEASEQGLVQWFEVRRELDLGIRFRIHTTVTRLGPANDSALVRVPLLPGEEVGQAGLVSDQGSVVINLPRGETATSYASSLSPVVSLKLSAAQPSAGQGAMTRPLSEVWVVAPSVLYRPTFEGIAPIAYVNAAGTYQPEYHPFPGETLTIHSLRLSGAEGASTTTDSAHVRFTPGTRLEQAKLTLQIRTSRGSTERILLPHDALLHSVAVDEVSRPARIKGGKLEIHLDPGAHQVVVSLQRPVGMELTYHPFTLGSERPLTNVTTEVQVPAGRWLLFARGPAWGPAVLFWGYLVVVMLCAIVLGQLALSPLKTYQWILLGLGLTQVEAPVALLIVGWLFALAYRERTWPKHPRLFNATQVMLVLLTIIALVCLGYAVHSGLVVQPSMQVEGMGSTDQLLRWYADRTGGAFPDVGVWSAPLWIYKALMLLWALWLAAMVIRWLRWGLVAMRSGGGYRSQKPSLRPPASSERKPSPRSEGGPGPEGAGVP